MTESELTPREQLAIYKTMLEDNRFQLLEMWSRHNAMLTNLPDAFSGASSDLLARYLRQLKSLMNACEAVRIDIEIRLLEME